MSQMDCTTEEVKECPRCKAGLDDLDNYLAPDGVEHWNCFVCGYDWCSIVSEPNEAEEEDNEPEEEE